MPRAPRIHINGGLYHVTLRGNHRNSIFHLPSDRDEFEGILGEALERYDSHVLAYCWMTNHVHAVIKIANQPLGRLVQLVASRYARRLQRRVPTTGHLFERRYRARVIMDEQYLLQAVRYIHLNPVHAGVVRDPAEYVWSSHRHYLNAGGPKWLQVDSVLRRLGESRKIAVAAYLSWLGAPPQACELNVRAHREFPPVPARFRRRQQPTLDALLIEAANLYGVSPAEMASRRRSPDLSAARATLAHNAVCSGTATLVEVAGRLNRAPSTVSWLLRRRYDTMNRDCPVGGSK